MATYDCGIPRKRDIAQTHTSSCHYNLDSYAMVYTPRVIAADFKCETHTYNTVITSMGPKVTFEKSDTKTINVKVSTETTRPSYVYYI